MIKSLFNSRSTPTTNNKASHDDSEFLIPKDDGASFDYMEATLTKETNSSIRICACCGEGKRASDFPMSLGKSRHCRFCVQLKARGLDLSAMSNDGDLSTMRDTSMQAAARPQDNQEKKSRRRRTSAVRGRIMDLRGHVRTTSSEQLLQVLETSESSDSSEFV